MLNYFYFNLFLKVTEGLEGYLMAGLMSTLYIRPVLVTATSQCGIYLKKIET